MIKKIAANNLDSMSIVLLMYEKDTRNRIWLRLITEGLITVGAMFFKSPEPHTVYHTSNRAWML